jgi:penicillin-binding protein 1A
MVRQEMVNRYGEQAYEDGYRVYTTITRKVQQAAQEAVRNNVLDYDMRHGYRGPSNVLWKVGETPWDSKKIVDSLKRQPMVRFLRRWSLSRSQEAVALLANGTPSRCDGRRPLGASLYLRYPAGATPRKVTDVVQTGQQIWVRKVGDSWWLSQVPDVNSALVSINPQNGAIMALVGGFDFNQSKFNRATQALRQVGSNIKPFLYTAAMDKGLTLASMLNDVPISRWDAGAGSDWQPKNSPPQYAGPIRFVRGWGSRKTW